MTTTTTNTPAPTGLDLVIERLQALTAELQQQAAAAGEPAAPLPVVLPEPELEELDQTELANALIQDVSGALAGKVARLIDDQVGLWLSRRQLDLPEWRAAGWVGAVRRDLTGMLLDLTADAEFTRAARPQWKHREPGAQGSHRYRLF